MGPDHAPVLSITMFLLKSFVFLWVIIVINGQTGDPDWWKNAVVYQIYPMSFKDDNNDGTGDLKGIISKLDYLKDLGVTATWLSPIYETSNVDQGYDIKNFKKIDERFGTMEDFEELVNEAHALGIKIVMDFVPNHSSNEHDWFVKSEAKEVGFEDFYIWKDAIMDKDERKPPNNWISMFKGPAWTWSEKRKQYYLHHFTSAQPDLNYRNSQVKEEMKKVLEFWLDKGVDGFRMDAVIVLVEDEAFEDEPVSNAPGFESNEHGYLSHIYTMDQPGTFDTIYEWRAFLEDYTTRKGGDARIMMTESYTDIKKTMLYYGDEIRDGAHFTFNFQFIPLNKSSTARDIATEIKRWFTYMPLKYTANWVLGNHDNHRMATRFGPERADGMNMLTAVLPGVMVTYQGEEIAQENGEVTREQGVDPSACKEPEEDFDKVSRDFERTPFHWDDSVNAGFNKGAKPWLPVSSKHKENNVKAQEEEENSHLKIYKKLLELKKEKAFKEGSWSVDVVNDNVLVVTREAGEDSSYAAVINLGGNQERIDLSPVRAMKKRLEVVVGSAGSTKVNKVFMANNIILLPYESLIARILPETNEDWWKHAVFYQIYPLSFKDADNDGFGDLRGIIDKLDHIKDAGVTAVWLSPVYKSPGKDQGYDISDFKAIDKKFGTMEHFYELVTKAHAMGIKIVMDFVPNHSSNQHEWFKKSEQEEHPYTNFYVWMDGKDKTPPNNWISLFKYSAWNYSKVRNQWYLHQFAPEQPDLNYRSPEVVQEMKSVLEFWMDRGVDGFRMDAVPYLVEHEEFKDEPESNKPGVPVDDYDFLDHTYTKDQQGTYDMIYEFRKFIDDYNKRKGGDPRIMMTEAYTDIENTMRYYGDDTRDGAHFTFNFQIITEIDKDSTAQDIVNEVERWFKYMPQKYTANWVLGNHDKDRLATRMGPERADAMHILTALLPGVMVTYQGEEIGMENGEVTWDQGQDPSACNGNPEDFNKVSRDFERTPFHWDDSDNAGFNEGYKPWLPVSSKYKANNLAAQKVAGLNSHYHIYQSLLKLRREAAIVNGTFEIFAISKTVLAIVREASNRASYVAVLNIGDKEEKVDLTEIKAVKKKVDVVLASKGSQKINRVYTAKDFTLSPHESIVARILPDLPEGNKDWWKTAVFYQIYPRSFKDDNNDGIGDLKGVISKLDHIKDAGVTAAWLSPIYTSPQVDAGYDISDFMEIDEDYGTLEDFDELIEKAHKLGIKIVMDFVPNHSSDEHDWFLRSERGEKGYENLYVWKNGKDGKKEPPNNWVSRFKYSAWQWSEIRQQFYYHQFAVEQPDLNYRDPVLVQSMKDVLKFWLDRGVDGFRMDAVPYLFEHADFEDEPSAENGLPEHEYESLLHVYTSDQPETFDMIYQWREFLEEYSKDRGGDARVMMTESYTDINNTMKYYGNDTHDGAHFTFNFQFVWKLYGNSTAEDTVDVINEWMEYLPERYVSNWVMGNHDNTRVATKFGPERVDGLNFLVGLLPGVMVTYNGEEIGQENGEVTWEQGEDPSACNGDPEDFDQTSRDFERTPFHWDDSFLGGFNDGAEPWLPVSVKYSEKNLDAQKTIKISQHYRIYQRLLKLRREKAFTHGNFTVMAFSENVLAFAREHKRASYVVAINIGPQTEKVDLTKFAAVEKRVDVVLASKDSDKYNKIFHAHNFTLTPYEAIVAKILPELPEGNSDWWKNAVFYQIYPRSFKDDNNDGIGDLKGIISKLHHIKDAGITAAWLSPIYTSPQVDAGYDISDFMDIDKDYGLLEDLDDLIEEAHKLGIKIVMDFVPNHSSDLHEWFIRSEKRKPGYENAYVWKDPKDGKVPNNWLSLFKYSAWNYSESRKQYYLHQFAPEQPDLNYRDPDVVQAMKDVLKFWLDKGVDGFRMDAVPYVFEDEKFEDEPPANNGVPENEHGSLKHIYTSDQTGTFDMIYHWRKFLDEYSKERGGDPKIMMTEAYTDIDNTMKYYGNDTVDGAHFTFNFQFVTKLKRESNAQETVDVIKEWVDKLPTKYVSNWVIGNHDNQRVATRFGPERVDSMNMLVGLLPGIMVTYNGEEIGMENGEVTWEQGQDPSACNGNPEDFNKVSRDFERTPFHWDDSINAGFNNGTEPWLPVSSKYKTNNLDDQKSLRITEHYRIYQRLLKLRREHAFKHGNFSIKPLADNVLAFTRESERASYVVVINIGNKKESLDLTKLKAMTKVDVVLASKGSDKFNKVFPADKFEISPYEGIVAKILPDLPEGNPDWWKNAVFYQIYPRSFKDDNNNGIGDLKGIISKLHHIKDAGITAAWLSPIYTSPQVDAGYDISDFMDIDKDYGLLEDLDELIEEAHKLGIKIVMDFVPNHSSDLNEWFIRSKEKKPGFENAYVWKDPKDGKEPNNWLSLFKYSAWNYSESRKQYYLHQFAPEQPDLNYRDPDVVQVMKDVLKFWLDKGVDGFRMDAVPYIFEHEKFEDEPSAENGVPENEHGSLKHHFTSDQPGTFDMIYQWRAFLEDFSREHGGDPRIMMTEAYTDIVNTSKYYGDDDRDGAHFTFNFQLITRLNASSNAKNILEAIDEWFKHIPDKYVSNWVIGNHDQHRVASRFGPKKADGFNMLISILPGVMVTYNGEEIGMENGEVTWEQGQDPSACNGKPEDFNKISRDFARTPFHWDDSVNAGFNEGHEPWLPVSSKYKANNLAQQSKSVTKSHYRIYKSLLEMRQEEAFINGKFGITAVSDSVLISRRQGSPSYYHMFNVGDASAVVGDLSQTYEDITPYLKIVVANVDSRRKAGDLLSTEDVGLDGYESIIAVTTDEEPTETTDSTNPTDTTEKPSTTTLGAGNLKFNCLLLVIALVPLLYLRH